MWCFFKLISVTQLNHRLPMDKGLWLLLLSLVSSNLISCLTLSRHSIKMKWMNKFYAVLIACYFIAKSYIIIEVEAGAFKTAHSLLCSLNPWPTRWHQALSPALITDRMEDVGGQERGEGKGWRISGYWVHPRPQSFSLLHDCGRKHLESALSII